MVATLATRSARRPAWVAPRVSASGQRLGSAPRVSGGRSGGRSGREAAVGAGREAPPPQGRVRDGR